MSTERVFKLAEKLWDYHHLNQTISQADIIICFTSFDLSVPVYVADLFKKGLAPQILFSGNNAYDPKREMNLQETNWGMSEAAKFKEVAVSAGVPAEAILIEENSFNSGQNVEKSYEVLKKVGKIPHEVILVQKPTMERRAYATFIKLWPEKNVHVTVTSPPYSFEEYIKEVVDQDVIINIMVGDLQRIKIYPKKGFQIFQEIPPEVWQAYEELVKLGYSQHLLVV